MMVLKITTDSLSLSVPPDHPGGVGTTVDGESVRVSWKPVEDADSYSHSHKLRELSKKDSVLTHTPSLTQCGPPMPVSL